MQMPHTSKHSHHATLLQLGEAIRSARKKRGISQEKLALISEIDRGYVGRIERGENNAAILTIQKVCKALNISISELMHEAGL